MWATVSPRVSLPTYAGRCVDYQRKWIVGVLVGLMLVSFKNTICRELHKIYVHVVIFKTVEKIEVFYIAYIYVLL